MQNQSSNYANDTVLTHLCQSTNPDLHIIAWVGDYSAAKQLADFVCSKVELAEYTVTPSGDVADQSGALLKRVRRGALQQQMHEIKQWLGDKITVINARDFRYRDVSKDSVLIALNLIESRIQQHTDAAKVAYDNAFNARLEHTRQVVRDLIMSGVTDVVSLANALIDHYRVSAELDYVTTPDRAVSLLQNWHPFLFGGDVADALAEITAEVAA